MSKVIELRQKINSIFQINKMTQAMQVVAVAKLKKIQSLQRSAEHFKRHYSRLAKRLETNLVPAAEKTKPVALLCAFFSERGFCSGFNEGIFSKIATFSIEQKYKNRAVKLIIFGKKGCEMARGKKLTNILREVPEIAAEGFDLIDQTVSDIYRQYLSGEFEEVYLIYNEFRTVVLQLPRSLRILPFDFSSVPASREDILLEVPESAVNDFVALAYLKAAFFDAFMQSALGEVASRLLTMRNATENSKEMLDSLKVSLNKARQAGITVELSEILSAFEILEEVVG